MHLFYADLHIHSKYSKATSKQITPRHLAAWAGIKGIDVLATGDFTHPGWLGEIENHLIQENDGLLTLKDPGKLDEEVPWIRGRSINSKTRFILCSEISSIYKRGGQVRKIHNLVFMPNLAKVKELNKRLAQIGNLKSDGRPILGLDSQHLLEIVLEIDPYAFVIPAHVWTPWFSLFGSKSGFDHIEECFGPLSSEIFALETGLSSDPEMNWLWSELDRFFLVSNSDAHSGEKLAREANIFWGEPGYETIYRALKGGDRSNKFLGTIEFFPEEGKYHLDGHRKCGVVLNPRETIKLGNKCPVCGTSLTVGVLNRVLHLADRDQPYKPSDKPGYVSLIPLPEILSEILGVGAKSKTVYKVYKSLLEKYKSELQILQHVPIEDLKPFSYLLAEAISRMRKQKVFREPGFDGQYGKISVFTPEEKMEFQHGKKLISTKSSKTNYQEPRDRQRLKQDSPPKDYANQEIVFNPEQEKAICASPEPVLVIAGPGTGKTRTLLGRIGHLLKQHIEPKEILAVTFTRAAAQELRKKVANIFDNKNIELRANTIHALAYERLIQHCQKVPVLLSEEEARKIFAKANPDLGNKVGNIWLSLSCARESKIIPERLKSYAQNYTELKNSWGVIDYTDLLESWLEKLQSTPTNPYTHLLVDEIQDLTHLQINILQSLVAKDGKGFFAIGDPKQSIYSFRGALSNIEEKLSQNWPHLKQFTLCKNFRSKQNLLDFSGSLFSVKPDLRASTKGEGKILYFHGQSGEQEAVWIANKIKSLLGGTGHLEADQKNSGELSPDDIAILVRIKALIPPIEKTLTKKGIPCSVPEQTPFWKDSRIVKILKSVKNALQINPAFEQNELDCPDHILEQGPEAIANYYKETPPFDSLFWQTRAYKNLKKSFAELGNWKELLNWISLESELDTVREKAQKIRIMTLHAAKGLEFHSVFIPGLEQGILPFGGKEFISTHSTNKRQVADEAEEKRLFYVGLTRAQNYLYISSSAKRKIYGHTYHLNPSPFLDLLQWEKVQKVQSVAHKKQQEKQLRLL